MNPYTYFNKPPNIGRWYIVYLLLFPLSYSVEAGPKMLHEDFP